LKTIDQIGLLSDNWGLGLAGYQPASRALDLLAAMPADANPRLISRVAGILGQVHTLFDGDERHQAMAAGYAESRLEPVFARIGWNARPSESAPVAILRTDLIRALGGVGDPRIVAEANRLYDSHDKLATQGALRTTILAVVARNVDASRWDRLHAEAKAEKNPLVRAQLYRLLAAAHDPALARRALDMALTAEPGATTGSAMIATVSGDHPAMAFDFAIANRERVEALVDASSRSRFIPGLGGGASDPAMIAKLEDYATRYMTPQSRRPADIAIGAIRDRVKVRRDRLPDIARWLDTHAA
jgi:aminopeptidase N